MCMCWEQMAIAMANDSGSTTLALQYDAAVIAAVICSCVYISISYLHSYLLIYKRAYIDTYVDDR